MLRARAVDVQVGGGEHRNREGPAAAVTPGGKADDRPGHGESFKADPD